MDLDFRQTRRLFLGGTVAFPTPYPSVGTISFEPGNLKIAPKDPAKSKTKAFVVVQDFTHRDRTMIRAMLQEDVSAIFVPGQWDANGHFQVSSQHDIDDFEAGEWFVDDEVTSAAVAARLRLSKEFDISTRESELKGIVFIAEDAPVVSIAEQTDTARASHDIVWPIPMMTRTGCYR